MLNIFYSNVSYTQNQAVTHVKGSEVNEGGTIIEAQTAINYYISNINEASINTVYYSQAIYSEENLLRFLDDGYVLYIVRGWYEDINDSNSMTGAHATLIYGYTMTNSDIWFLVRDPWPVDKGETFKMSYEKLCNGRNYQVGENEDIGVWIQSIVVDTSYDNITEAYYFDK